METMGMFKEAIGSGGGVSCGEGGRAGASSCRRSAESISTAPVSLRCFLNKNNGQIQTRGSGDGR